MSLIDKGRFKSTKKIAKIGSKLIFILTDIIIELFKTAFIAKKDYKNQNSRSKLPL